MLLEIAKYCDRIRLDTDVAEAVARHGAGNVLVDGIPFSELTTDSQNNLIPGFNPVVVEEVVVEEGVVEEAAPAPEGGSPDA